MKVYYYIIIMAVVTYLIRMLPLTLFQKKITNPFFQSLLYYIPYACLMAMTFPAIFYVTEKRISGIVGLVVAICLSLREKSLVVVAFFACLSVFIMNLLF